MAAPRRYPQELRALVRPATAVEATLVAAAVGPAVGAVASSRAAHHGDGDGGGDGHDARGGKAEP
jgi:hypothetical protein